MMEAKQQTRLLQGCEEIAPFAEKLKSINCYPLRATQVEIFQINVGKRCNMSCKHCHVDADPNSPEMISRDILDTCYAIIKNSAIPTIDITGGAPEMNPYLEQFITRLTPLGRRLIVRTNLTILTDPHYHRFIDIYTRNKVEIVASLPDFKDTKVNRQRGEGSFEKSIAVMKLLNAQGYGIEGSGLILNLVHNPVGAFLPGSETAIENEYKRNLKERYGVMFNSLFCLTNFPLGRYLEYLLKSENFSDYMSELASSFNPKAAYTVMCKNTISVGWDGTLYDCDFNQMLELPVDHGAPSHIDTFDLQKLKKRQIIIGNHCYACTAGSGSSCQGSLDT